MSDTATPTSSPIGVVSSPMMWRVSVEHLIERMSDFDCQYDPQAERLYRNSVYVYTNEPGQALYIGQTQNLGGRFEAHARSRRQPWFPNASAYYWFDGICCRKHVLLIEAELIRIWNPKHNKVGVVR